MPALEKIFAERNACPKAVVSLAAVVSTGVVRDSFGMICQRLESRLASEEASPANLRKTDSELQALSATKKNAQDFFQFRAALLTAFDSISVPSSGGSDGPVPRESGSADGTSAYLLVKSFYSLLGWMLMVQPDRLSLTTSRTTPAPSSRAQNSAEPPVHVTYYDPPSGKITIERASAAFRWGLMINMEGRLIGLENALRTATPTGGELYYALQLRDDGLPIYSINGVSLRDAEDTGKGAEETEEIQTKRLEKLQEILKGKQTKVTLIVGGVPGLHDPQVVAFELVHQGGEGALGQEACLILRRASLSVDWGIKLSKNEDGQLILDGVSSSLALSSDANEFINAHIGNLHVVQVNGFGSSSRNFHEDIMRTSLFLKLRLQSVAKVGPGATEAGAQDKKGNLTRPFPPNPGPNKTPPPPPQE
uniref:WGS project CAEQ00000000 data, annotated contig 176 n=1 Tax=Trypanosoma congolense (strain IL3000) TaxID=1068625 RepID=F9W8Q6_TRYCI|nr:unnamed protein product [Trypanosoma congolense IL3000]